MFILPWLAHIAISNAKLLQPRETGPSITPQLPSVLPVTATSLTRPPCCFIWNGFTGVKVNTWYPEAYTQYTATVVTTFVQINGSVAVANSTTRYIPSNETWSSFGMYGGVIGGGPYVPNIPGIPTNLIPSGLIGDGDYAGTTIVSANMTAVTFDFTDLTVYSPTPYAIYSGLGVYTADPSTGVMTDAAQPMSLAAAQCGSFDVKEFITVSSGNWQYVNHTEFYAYNAGQLTQINDPFISIAPIVQPLRSALPNQYINIALPEGFYANLLANKTFLSMYPWVTDCYTIAGVGEPTVHVAVDQLTTDSSVFLTQALEATPITAQLPTLLTSTAHLETPVRSPAAASSKADSAVLASSTPAVVVQSTSDAARTQLPTTTRPDEIPPNTVAVPGITAQPSPPGSGTITLGTTTATYELMPSGVIIAGQTLSPGGSPITLGSQTIAFVAQTNGPAIIVNGASTQLLAAPVQQTITAGGQILTVAAGTSVILVDGTTIQPGQATIVKGQTFSLAGTNIVIAGSGTTTTQGLGGAIISGIGGGRGVTYTGLASKHVAMNMIGVGLGLVALFV